MNSAKSENREARKRARDQGRGIAHADEELGPRGGKEVAQQLGAALDHGPDTVRLDDQPVDADEPGIGQDQPLDMILIGNGIKQLHLHIGAGWRALQRLGRVAQKGPVAPRRRRNDAVARQTRAVFQN